MTVDSFYFARVFENDGGTEYTVEQESTTETAFRVYKVDDTDSAVRTLLTQDYHYFLEFEEHLDPIYTRVKILLAAPIASGHHLEVLRDTPIVEEFTATDGKPFPTESWEYYLDKACYIEQELEGHLCACPSYPEYPGIPPLTPEVPTQIEPGKEPCEVYSCEAMELEWRGAVPNGAYYFWPTFQNTRYPGVWCLAYHDAGGYDADIAGTNTVPWNYNLRNYLAASPEMWLANQPPPGVEENNEIPRNCRGLGIGILANVTQAYSYVNTPEKEFNDMFWVGGDSGSGEAAVSAMACCALYVPDSYGFKSAPIMQLSVDGFHTYGFGSDVTAGIYGVGTGNTRLQVEGTHNGINLNLNEGPRLHMVVLAISAYERPNPTYPAKRCYEVVASVYVDGDKKDEVTYVRYDSEGWNINLVRFKSFGIYGSPAHFAFAGLAPETVVSAERVYALWQRQFDNYVDPRYPGECYLPS